MIKGGHTHQDRIPKNHDGGSHLPAEAKGTPEKPAPDIQAQAENNLRVITQCTSSAPRQNFNLKRKL